ncbi:MAG TPA: HD domain-containing phosphohydrolase [Gemmatimonadales bacterium]
MPNRPPPPSVALLVVDDEEPIRNALKRFLEGEQFAVHTAASGQEALTALQQHDIALMLADIRMPGMSGIDLVPQALEVAPDLAVVMLSAVNDATTAALCMQRGAMDYLTKPIELDDLARAVQRALRRRAGLVEGRHLEVQLKEEWARERVEAHRVTIATLEAMVNAMEARDPYLRGHSARVADLAATVAAHLRLSDDEVEQIRLAGRLHDIGKIGTRESVMNKQGPLTPEEYEHVKQHVIIGSQILSPLVHLGPVLGSVRSHHERWDGTGYPDGLRGEEIPIGARIIGAAEIYDALCTSRPYQEKLPSPQAIRRMGDLAGHVLDPKVFAALAEVVTKRRSLVFLEGADGA